MLALWRRLATGRKYELFAVGALTVASACADVATIGAVIPFLAVLMDARQALDVPLVSAFAQRLGVASSGGLALLLTLVFCAGCLVAAVLRILLVWLQNRAGLTTGSEISVAVYRRTLALPYSVHVERTSSEAISTALHKVEGAVLGVLMPLLQLASSAALVLLVLAAVAAVDLRVALVATVTLGGAYALISWRTRNHLARMGRRMVDEQGKAIGALQEGLGGIRDVILDGTQQHYCDLFSRADRAVRQAQATSNFIAQSPRFVIEACGIVAIAVLAYAWSTEAGATGAVPFLGALALGAQRLLPALQQAYNAWASIIGNRASLADVVEILERASPDDAPAQREIPYRRSLRLEGVRFRHRDAGAWILDGVDLEVPRGARVGIVGSSGSGKTTLVDIMMGLLEPTQGVVRVDDEALTPETLASWRRRVAHVPQSIFLADSTLAQNIAFGVAPGAVDMQRVREAARRARLSDFVERCPRGYEESVGERGIRLSGGQQQRVAIARALYKRPDILFFDEATSALDAQTERSVLEAIDALGRDLTVVIVAHRLSVLRGCDFIVRVEDGKAAALAGAAAGADA
ncbi:ABC transporter ATP-binding protein [Ramlibacter sp. PS4R-6]|uniref:ABC transporter ATP-binding protein n=1 Tax=Ramlibacter sp. PS4R-6 TaxID=3133438 RepID=UPI0030A0188C